MKLDLRLNIKPPSPYKVRGRFEGHTLALDVNDRDGRRVWVLNLDKAGQALMVSLRPASQGPDSSAFVLGYQTSETAAFVPLAHFDEEKDARRALRKTASVLACDPKGIGARITRLAAVGTAFVLLLVVWFLLVGNIFANSFNQAANQAGTPVAGGMASPNAPLQTAPQSGVPTSADQVLRQQMQRMPQGAAMQSMPPAPMQ